jgi:hypothetical protein
MLRQSLLLFENRVSMREDHVWMNWFLALIRVADVGKFIVLSALIFFGIVARHVAVWDTSKDPFRIIPSRNNQVFSKKQELFSSDSAVILALAQSWIVPAAGSVVVYTPREL